MAKKKPKGSPEKEKWLRDLGKTYAKELVERATGYELEFKAKLDLVGAHYIFQHPVVCEQNHLFILDFYLPDFNIAFELDGYQHYTKSGLREDKRRTSKLKKLGILVKRIPNYNVRLVTPELIRNYLDQRVKPL